MHNSLEPYHHPPEYLSGNGKNINENIVFGYRNQSDILCDVMYVVFLDYMMVFYNTRYLNEGLCYIVRMGLKNKGHVSTDDGNEFLSCQSNNKNFMTHITYL